MRRVVAAGVTAGVVAAVLSSMTGWPPRPNVSTATTKPAQVEAFLAAWRRQLGATYVLVQVIDRRLVSGRRFSSEVRLVQRPPDRIRTGGGGLGGRLGGRRFGCVLGGGCRDGGPAPDYGREVEAEVAVLRSLVTGSGAPYGLSRVGRCFRLILRARILAPPYGEDATFCFDPRTGAQARAVIHRAEATDTARTVSLRARVGPADLAVPGYPDGS